MKKTITLWAVLILLTFYAQARTVTGYVKGEGKALAAVLVTDGFSFTQTNADGMYAIEPHQRAEFVYIVTPQGYVADYSSGVPQFYQRLTSDRQVYNFDLKAMKGDRTRYSMITMADPQLDTPNDIEKLFNEALPDIKQTAQEHASKGVQVAGIVLGDMTWDVYGLNDVYKDFARQCGFPLYPVIGNHDYDKFLTPSDSADYGRMYKQSFGPIYYAFQLGEAYYVVLSNMRYTGNKGYRVTLEIEDQMRWLEFLLNKALNMGNRVYIAMHAPLQFNPESAPIGGGQHLLQMLNFKFESAILTGHMHRNSNTDLGAGIMEHNIGALCGNWWSNAVSSDGTPCGYQVFEGVDRNLTNWYFKATGHPADYQFKLYPRGSSLDRPNAVVAKVWNYDESWQIRWYQDGKFMGNMERFYSFDPDYLKYVNGARVVDDYFPVRHNRFFSATPDAGAHEIKVEAVDHFGHTYTQTIQL
ncbi:MAG: calcineurin-like phosphoesterase C-terminal domain-containing protein [Bacteroidales bacterium]|nr:calcineurin-like phosphoesterase C-terminal domain-containing protein [Candidatus Colimorpha onthohippi]